MLSKDLKGSRIRLWHVELPGQRDVQGRPGTVYQFTSEPLTLAFLLLGSFSESQFSMFSLPHSFLPHLCFIIFFPTISFLTTSYHPFVRLNCPQTKTKHKNKTKPLNCIKDALTQKLNRTLSCFFSPITTLQPTDLS